MKLPGRKTTANMALAIWQGNEYMLNFLFPIQLQFQQTNNAHRQAVAVVYYFLNL